MKAKMMAPIASIHGTIAKGYYARVIYGKQVIQRCPVRQKPASAKQKAAREWFAENLAGRKWRDVASGNRVVSEVPEEKGVENYELRIKNYELWQK